MTPFERQIAQLQKQRTQLDERLNKLLQERNKTILKILDQLPTENLDTATLMGGLMEVCDRATQDQTQAEVWRQAGAKFCKARKNAKAPLPDNAAHEAA